jgi:addiction module HigA family antidote
VGAAPQPIEPAPGAPQESRRQGASKSTMRLPTRRAPTPPGEILLEEWLKPMKLTQLAIAKKMGVGIQLLNGIVNGRRSVTAKTALLLAKVLETTPELWLNAQMAVDLWHAQEELKEERQLKPAKDGSKNGDSKAARPHATARQQAARRRYLELTGTKVSQERIAAIRAQWQG